MADRASIFPPARYEPQDVVFRYLVLGLTGTILAVLLSLLLVIWLYPTIEVDKRLTGSLPPYPQPRLQSDPAADMGHFLHLELARLNSSGWVDRAHGIAHIPIDDAMHRVARQGIPDWPAADKNAP